MIYFQLLQRVQFDQDLEARAKLNEHLRKHPGCRKIMAKHLIDEQAIIHHLRDESIVSLLNTQQESYSQPLPRKPPLKLWEAPWLLVFWWA